MYYAIVIGLLIVAILLVIYFVYNEKSMNSDIIYMDDDNRHNRHHRRHRRHGRKCHVKGCHYKNKREGWWCDGASKCSLENCKRNDRTCCCYDYQCNKSC